MARTPTDLEQELLEFINRARANPAGEFDKLILQTTPLTGTTAEINNALRYFGVDAGSFRTQLASLVAAPPLAWPGALATSATLHTELMIAQDTQSHLLPGEAGLSDRVRAAGYDIPAGTGFSLAENVYAFARSTAHAHAGFYIDWGYDDVDFAADGTLLPDWASRGDGNQDQPGHRNAQLNARYTETGIAMLAESDPATSVGPWLVTQNSGGRSDYKAQLVGVIIADADGDRFYDAGERLAGVTITATSAAGSFTTTSWSSGGYQLELPAGSYVVTFGSGLLAGVAQRDIVIAADNIKLDLIAGDVRYDTSGARQRQ